jgi:hypothetical protein
MRSASATFASVALITLAVPALGQSGSPAASGDAELDYALAVVALMNEAPDGIRETCSPTTPAMEGMVAVAQCSYGDDTVIYARFDDEASLHAGYDAIASGSGLSPDTGSSCDAGPFEGPFQAADGIEAGRLLCAVAEEGYVAVWTDPGRSVLGALLAVSADSYPAVQEHWLAVRMDVVKAAASPAPPEASPAPPDASGPLPDGGAEPVGASPPTGGTVRQWATGATASSTYSDDLWSAMQATGPPDAPGYGDSASAWAPSGEAIGVQWIELTYDVPVVPTGIVIRETSGNGFVTLVQAWDETADGWVTLWEGVDPSPQDRYGFEPTLAATDVVTDRIRITIDTDVEGWNEIDSVELVGTLADQP